MILTLKSSDLINKLDLHSYEQFLSLFFIRFNFDIKHSLFGPVKIKRQLVEPMVLELSCVLGLAVLVKYVLQGSNHLKKIFINNV